MMLLFLTQYAHANALVFEKVEIDYKAQALSGEPLNSEVVIMAIPPGIRIKNKGWKIIDENGNFQDPSDGDVFEKGKSYMVCFEVVLQRTQDSFSYQNTKFILNGKEADYKFGDSKKMKVYQEHTVIGVIENTNIEGLQIPKEGEVLNISDSDLRAVNPSGEFSISRYAMLEYFTVENPKLMENGEKFRAGYQYMAVMQFDPKPNFKFKTGDSTRGGLANGIYQINLKPKNESVNYIDAIISFGPLKGEDSSNSSSEMITKVKIEEHPILLDGKKYSEAIGNVKITGDGGIKVRSVVLEGNYYGTVYDGDTFDVQDDYTRQSSKDLMNNKLKWERNDRKKL